MHLKTSDPKAAEINHILLDGKRVVMVVELDTDEGWVDIILPKIDENKAELIEAGGADKVSDRYFDKEGQEKVPAGSVEWETKRLFGKVEVDFREDSQPSSD